MSAPSGIIDSRCGIRLSMNRCLAALVFTMLAFGFAHVA